MKGTRIALHCFWIAVLCIVQCRSIADLCIDEKGLANRTFFIAGNAGLIFEWWQKYRSAVGNTSATFFIAVIAKGGAIGWFGDNAALGTVPGLLPGLSIHSGPLAASSIPKNDSATTALAAFFSEIKRRQESAAAPLEIGMNASSGDDRDTPHASEIEIESKYNGKPLVGLVAVTMVEVNLVSRPGYEWSAADVLRAESGLFSATLSLSFLAAQYCRGVTWLVDLVRHDDQRAAVSGITTANLHDSAVWIPRIATSMGTDDSGQRAMIAGQWASIGIPVAVQNTITAYVVTAKTAGPCGLSIGGRYVLAVVHTTDKTGCAHWRPQTILMHELLHCFGACDEYGNCGCRCPKQWCQNDPSSCFNNWNCENCMPSNRCVMRRGETLGCMCPATALQIGWGTFRRQELGLDKCAPVPSPVLTTSAASTVVSLLSLVLSTVSLLW